MQTAHQSALTARHAILDRQIALETQRPLPNAAMLADLKKRKLLIKEELERI